MESFRTDFSLEHNHRLSSTSTTQNPNFPSSDVASVLWWSVRPSRRRHHPSPTPSVGVLSKPFLVCLLTRKGLFFSGRNLFAVGSEFVRFGFSETISIGLLCRLVDWCMRQIAAVTVVVFGGSVSFLLARFEWFHLKTGSLIWFSQKVVLLLLTWVWTFKHVLHVDLLC